MYQPYQTQELPVLRMLTTRQQCQDVTSSPNTQQRLTQERTVQVDDRMFALGLLLGMVVIAVWALKFVYGM